MSKDPAMEAICDKIRSGEPVGVLDAIAAINYQGQLKAAREAERKQTLWGRFLNWIGYE